MDILCLPRLATLLLTGAALAAPHAAPAATFVVGAGAGCTHGSIQAAVDAAAASPGFDTIRITRSLAYSNQAIVVEADTGGLEFLGGYADCQTITTSLPRTWVSGAGAPPAAVFSLRGSSSVFLSGLEISDGDNDTGGGGIDIVGGPKTVLLDNLLIRGNRGLHGGGVSARHSAPNTTELQVLIDGNTAISGNTATDDTYRWGGGGLYCENARVLVQGRSWLMLNASNSQGGGIGADFCDVEVGSEGLLGGVLLDNSAATQGGGISVRGGRARFRLYTVDPANPATIIGNIAGGHGGAIYISGNAGAEIYDGVIRDNIARRGGAVSMLEDDGGTSAARFLMQGTTLGAPPGARNCANRERCNRISGNRAQDANGMPREGAAFYLSNSSGAGSNVVATLRSTRLDGNVGQSLLDMLYRGDAAFDGTVIEGNVASGPLFDAGDAHEQNLVLAATTIAGNAIGAGQPVIRGRDACSIDGALYVGTHVYRSIAWQPGHALLATGGTPTAECFQYVLANDLGPLPASPLNRTGDPRFVDAASGNYRLRTDSPALDFATAQPANSTRDLGPRVLDDPQVPDEFGAHDLGAYELDLIFADGFD